MIENVDGVLAFPLVCDVLCHSCASCTVTDVLSGLNGMQSTGRCKCDMHMLWAGMGFCGLAR